MNEIPQKRIEEAAYEYIQSDAVSPENMKLAFGDFINGAKWALQNQWISVEEALPEENKLGDSDFVFVKTSIRYPFLASYSYKHETWKDINHIAIHGVTHWTPIPELKGGEE